MSNGIQFRIQATKEQLEQMEQQCVLSEQMFAATLARRIEGLKVEEAYPFIVDWFQTVRHMAHANWISCNIQSQATPIGASLEAELAEWKKKSVEDRFAHLVAQAESQDGDEQAEDAEAALTAVQIARRSQRLANVNEFIQKTYCVIPNSQQLDILRKLL